MQCYPIDIEQKVGFDIVRRSIEDRLQTPAGIVRWRSEQPSSDPLSVERRLRAVSEWQEALQTRQSPGLSDLSDLTEALGRIAPAGSWLEPPEILAIISSMALARHVASFFVERSDHFPTLAAACADIYSDADLEKSLGRVVDDQAMVRDDASPELRRIRKQIRSQEGSIRTAAEKALGVARGSGYAAGDAPTIKGGRVVIPVRVEGRRKLPGAILDTSASGRTAFLEPEACLDLGNELRLLEAHERREIVRILIGVTDTIRTVAAALIQNQRLLARQDVLRAKAHLANQLEAVLPAIGDGALIRLEHAVNPALFLLRKEGANKDPDERPVIPLDLTLQAPDSTLVISGPNAGGKSVAMKTLGLLTLMLSYGMPIPCAEGSILPLFDRLMVAFGDDQSLENDLSTFSSHLENLHEIVDHAGPGALILIDEIGTGTDPAAGEAIAGAVLEFLSGSGGFSVVTTHFGGLKAMAHESPGMVNGAMRFDPDLLEPTYVFEAGVPGSSYALEIAERTKFPKFLLERAHQSFGAERARIEELILSLSKAKQDAVKQSEELEKQLQRAVAAETKYRETKDHLDDSRDAVLRQAHEKAEQLLKEANRSIERTIREIKESQADKAKTKEARHVLEKVRREVRSAKPQPKKRSVGKKELADVSRPLVAGDSVVLDGGSAVGEIVRVERNRAVVAFELAQMQVAVERLTRVDAPKSSAKTRRRAGSNLEPALHIAPRLDVRGYRVADAIPVLEKYLDDAFRAGLHKIELIHGTGTGALGEALRVHLRSMVGVASIENAPVEQGGDGVTYVFLS